MRMLQIDSKKCDVRIVQDAHDVSSQIAPTKFRQTNTNMHARMRAYIQCMHTCMHTHTCRRHMHTHIHAYMHKLHHITNKYTCTNICTYIHAYTARRRITPHRIAYHCVTCIASLDMPYYVHACMHACIRTLHTYTDVPTNIRTRMHACILTQKHT